MTGQHSFTPGPWTYGVRKDRSIWLSIGDPACCHYQGDLVASEADARLICAVPEMFEALEAIEFALSQGMPAAMVLDENSPIRDCLRAAIKKAGAA
jgi:hypothetical protein